MFCVTFVTTATGKSNYFGEIEYVLLVLLYELEMPGMVILAQAIYCCLVFITKRKTPNVLLLYILFTFFMCFISLKLGSISHFAQF